MPTATLTSKGQVTIPLALRNALGLNAGVKLDFIQDETGIKIVPFKKTASALKGRFAGRVQVPVTCEMMDTAIAQAASECAINGNQK